MAKLGCKIILPIVFFLALLIGISLVSAVECGVTPTNGCTVSSSTTFNNNNYSFNDTEITGGSLNKNDYGSMVLFYKFNNDSSVGESYATSTALYDYSDSRINATLQTGTYLLYNEIGGYFGDGAFEFNKSSAGRVLLNSDIIINTSVSNYTINFWAKQTVDADNTLFGDNDTYDDYVRLSGDNNRVAVEFSTTETNYLLSYSRITETNFNMYTLKFNSYNSTHSNLSLFVNGVYQDSELYNLDILRINRIGDGYGGTSTSQYFNGTIDEFIIWNESLSYGQVSGLHNYYTSTGAVIIANDNLILDCNNSIILGNATSSTYGIIAENLENITIKNCDLRNYAFNLYLSGLDNKVLNNSFNGTGSQISKNVFLSGSGFLFDSNNISYGEYGLDGAILLNSNISNNYFTHNDRALEIRGGSSGLRVSDNTFFDNSANYDNYNLDVWIRQSTDITVDNNIFNKSTSTAIFSQGANVTITNNQFIFVPISERGSYSASDLGYPPVAILLTPTYKSFLQGGDNDANRLAEISVWNNYNITATGNTYENIDIYIHSQGTSHLTTDLTDYKFISFQAPPDYFSRSDYYINPSFTNISRYQGGINDTLLIAYNSNGKVLFEHKINKDYLYFKNVNTSSNPDISKEIYFYNLTNALIYNTNNSIYGNSDISLNDGNINITLTPNNASCVFDEANLTEGVSRGSGSCVFPLWFSSTSSTSKHIASNLTDTINITMVFDVSSCNIQSISYTSDSGATSYSPTYSCSNNTVTISQLNGIEPASSSNILTINYPSTGGGGSYNPPTCHPLWICDVWSGCSNNLRTRQCVDINHCNSNENPPLLLSCSLPLPSDRITGCVNFVGLDGIIGRWKLNIFRFDILNEGIYKWKHNIDC